MQLKLPSHTLVLVPSSLARYAKTMNVAATIDHTVLKATTTRADIVTLCAEAKKFNFKAVCVNPAYITLAKTELAGSEVQVATVCGFPLGAITPEQKAWEAAESVRLGADEIDMVVNIGAIKSAQWDLVKADIAAVRQATEHKILKVIIETCYLTDEEKRKVSQLCVEAKADFVKTSTGFGTGGATLADVTLIKSVVGDHAQIKASGGVRSYEDAVAMLAAGASRLGTSNGVAIVQGQNATEGY